LPWEAIKYVSTGFTLCAFVVAALLSYLKNRTQEQRKSIESARPEDRADLVSRTLEFFNIDTQGLSREQQFLIAMRQINGRIERYRLVAIVVVVLAIIGAGLSAYAITVQNKSGQPTPKPSGESDRGNPAGRTPSKPEQGVTVTPRAPVDASANTPSQVPAQSEESATRESPAENTNSPSPLEPRAEVSNSSVSGKRSTETQRSDKTPVLFRCDADCTLRIDGKSAGSLKPNDSVIHELSSGDHVIEAVDRTGATTWTQTLTVRGTSQILVTAELQKLLFGKNSAWLLGNWERRTSSDSTYFSRDSVCWWIIKWTIRMNIILDNNRTQLAVGIHYSRTSEFPNSKYEGVCDSEKRDEDADFLFVVTELSEQSAKATLKTVQKNEGTFDWPSYCRSSCNTITLSPHGEGGLVLEGMRSTYFDGEYERAN